MSETIDMSDSTFYCNFPDDFRYVHFGIDSGRYLTVDSESDEAMVVDGNGQILDRGTFIAKDVNTNIEWSQSDILQEWFIGGLDNSTFTASFELHGSYELQVGGSETFTFDIQFNGGDDE